ncbi:MAG: glycosyltransferase family 39 protein [Luteolibacter sp.]
MSRTFSLTPGWRRCLITSFWIVFVLRVAMLFQIPITDNSESRYAEMARWMVASGNWITPEIEPGIPFWAKPPLSMWVSACGIKIFGPNEFGARIFIFLTACAVLLLIYRWAAKQRGKDFALISSFILFTAPVFVVTSGSVMTDLVMTAGTTLCMVSFWNVMTGSGSSRRWNTLFFFGLAIGLLAKGPIATVLTLLPIGTWAFMTRLVGESWKRLPWLRGGFFTLALVAPWYIAAEIRTPGFLDYFLLGEHLKRFLVPGWEGDLYGSAHSEARGTIWLFGLSATFPWSMVLLFMGPVFFRRHASIRDGLREENHPWLYYLLCWSLAPLFFFTLSRNIISTYTLTGVPAIALVIPELWRLAQAPEKRLRIFLGIGTAFSLLTIFGIWVCYLWFEDFAPKRSEKRITEIVKNSREFDASSLHYLGSRRYSASFYRNGEVDFIKPDKVPDLLTNKKHDVLVLGKKEENRLSSLLSPNFRKVAEIGHRSLFSEIPTSTDVRSPKN